MSIIVARKRLGHFTASSQEEQIASAPHDRSGDGPERGLCSPRGKPECQGLAAEAAMFLEMGWQHAVVFTLALSLQPRSTRETLGVPGSSKPNLNPNPKDLKMPFLCQETSAQP